MILVELLLPGFNNLIRNYQSSDLLMMNFNDHAGKQVDVNYHSAGLYIGIISIVLFCGLLAGSYPALYLSSLKPLNIMKGILLKIPVMPNSEESWLFFSFHCRLCLSYAL